MISNGHSWSSIQKYSLAEIGIFFKTIVQLDKEERKERLTYHWLGANLEHQGLQDVLEKIDKGSHNSGEPNVEEVNNDWRRLAAFMAGKK